MSEHLKEKAILSKDDFSSDQEVRWCPGCGDYSILAQMKKVLPELGIPKEKIVFVSGIGCSSRFPYYVDTYGIHGIHGRAPAIAAGVKLTNPELKVFIVTGDGDGLSIGGNHLMHLCRRNLDVTVLLFNNRIYGLTKGQYSPTSEKGKITKSSPFGAIDNPFDPVKLALAAGASFVARSIDRDPKHLAQTMREAAEHKGTAFVEIYQNCNIFNDGAFFELTDNKSKKESVVYMQDGQALIYGQNDEKGLRWNGLEFETVDAADGDVYRHNAAETPSGMAFALAELNSRQDMPVPMGVFVRREQNTYDMLLTKQIEQVKEMRGEGDLNKLLYAGNTWEVK